MAWACRWPKDKLDEASKHLGMLGININVIAPGYFPTKMTAPIDMALGGANPAAMSLMNRVYLWVPTFS